ncbi:1-deoxy-D-xylulose-5-phosphate synthase [Taylorella equigenitalis]|uniref:1-deoxy-D-xylulose-5-phosphate synthase n=3 Tax=Taylorella equigenitalis TaxID=29575 RepID=A0A654KF55_TAYEM|nr:1-deoxy-D-xylulose-5-phosphate synthase [Taylorella equigenitalis]ADU91040.1 1-deoxy-D-xylulose 5-phosphate synthase [Taylorella equigenitalis MCE9]AFN36143.1 1-deoxy-D-xylulose-5-phosphate synthase [Taylorella equigenitalis ATCC 35865]ASY30774.1 1-deoxy-D-xylulose-5-phosphate synthase [Taylorella equigenitalis]ASY39551.1 1-deoxy-D-xylulose-5-phosphate synthase [Taylorella equigenitalis]ASY41054.1 1-deoxy-D-xylulose-5-phosphate synthase [Taylorella equigenitalis]
MTTFDSILKTIDTPLDLRKLESYKLYPLCSELREFILESVSKTGGHLSSNLGTVELAVALHYVFNTPDDKLIWDVGHQSYAHKILTGRRDRMSTLRQSKGISGFPKRSESEYDAFGTAHSSTSISAALGMAIASHLNHEDRQHIAVIGDGAMSAGMAFEALNNAASVDGINLIVILNDNDMSISPPVGALNKYLTRLLSGSLARDAHAFGKAMLERMPSPVLELARKLKGHAKGIISPATWFEEFGFNYSGPIDGHDLGALLPTLSNLKKLGGLQFLHVVTKKGYGYKLAENDPVLYHGPGKFDRSVGVLSSSKKITNFTDVFSDWVCDQASVDPKLIAITPAMREGSGLVEFEQKFPDRYFDVGIAEQHAVTFAGGLACSGYKPVVAIYSTFLQRAYDQLIHDVVLQNLDVTFAIDRAGIVGADGATHAGVFDIAFMRCLPDMVISVPSDEDECRKLLTTCYKYEGPSAVRYPRGAGVGNVVSYELETVNIGEAHIKQKGSDIAILCFGPLVHEVLKASKKFTVVDMRFVKPLDTKVIEELALSHKAFVTIEEGVIQGGAGSAVSEFLNKSCITKPLLQLGLPDSFVDHGDQKQLLAEAGLDASGIIKSIEDFISKINVKN